ncbi:hypothetical protein L798_00770 [Zootermopsis nevadensis]|uniref:Uncharacterized protein n=1 Tax=Zootermopsis nevadensis TaxID=136037 RepID=A0A067QKI5_ZOONE|nr:hypothetical protein L798_00770 [Zootermopsis nevadensis]
MWKWIPKKGTENSTTHINQSQITSTKEQSGPLPTPIWMNHLPTPEILPPRCDILVINTPGCGAGFRQSAFGTYLDTGTYF